MTKNRFCELMEEIRDYTDFQKFLIQNGYGVEDSNVGNVLVLTCIELIKDTFGIDEYANDFIEEFCWKSDFGRLYYPTFYFNNI